MQVPAFTKKRDRRSLGFKKGIEIFILIGADAGLSG
jgi:hypothetical protein